MKIKTTVLYLAAGLVLVLSPMVAVAQNSGAFAVAQPKPPFALTQGPAIATRAPFRNLPAGSSPIVIIQPQVVTGNPFFIPGQIFPPSQTVVTNPVFAPTQVFVPNQVFAPNQVFIPSQSVFPTSAFPSMQIPSQATLPPTQLLIPGQTVIPATTSQPAVTPVQSFFGRPRDTHQQTPNAAPTLGTSRADLLRQFGQPIVTVGTSTSETLYFADGTKVTLQNGHVTGSK